jgi:magnesium chelatase accessory protein
MWTAADSLSWERDGQDWPNRETSSFVEAGGLTWHVQRMGQGPPLLLVHGTGASTHSWRDLAPALAQRFEVVAFDLPGHGFTSCPAIEQLTLSGMANAAGRLIESLGFSPALLVGHSAGAAIASRMSLDGIAASTLIVSLNGALLPFSGLARHVFPPLAKLLYTNRIAPRLMAWRARDLDTVSRLLEGTGSRIDARGVALYQRLFATPAHVAATLSMMARWDLVAFERDLPQLRAHLALVVGALDRAIPAEEGLKAARLVQTSSSHFLRNVGHLAHEEWPHECLRLVLLESFRARILDEASMIDGSAAQ